MLDLLYDIQGVLSHVIEIQWKKNPLQLQERDLQPNGGDEIAAHDDAFMLFQQPFYATLHTFY